MKKRNTIFLIIGAIIFLIILVPAISGGNSSNSDDSKTTSTQNQKKTYGFDEEFEFDDLKIKIGANYSFTTIDNEFSDNYGKSVVKVPITVTNLKNETHGLNMFYYTIYGSKGTKVDSPSTYFMDDAVDFAGDLRSDASYTKYLYFIYDGDGNYAIEFNNFSSKKTVEFNIKK